MKRGPDTTEGLIGTRLTSAPRLVQMAGVMTRRTQGVRVCVVLGLAAALAGCATVQQQVGGWFGAATPTPTPTPRRKAAATVVPRVYYAGSDGLTVFKGPSASSKVVGKLSLHEKVTRTKLEGGFAYVESATGTKGWVANAQLIRRVPTAAATAAPAPAPGEPETDPETEPEPEAPVAPAAEEPQVPAAPEATAAAAEPPPALTPVPAPPTSHGTPRDAAPSIFDAY